ncbi:MAG: cadherin-like beta sandwich domain-containing protein [Candidatus Nomurabacteria bacterium]|nr:cadherin-like beta sandwich domain-containing protein [Candidatus Nomurabacteria bacterium]
MKSTNRIISMVVIAVLVFTIFPMTGNDGNVQAATKKAASLKKITVDGKKLPGFKATKTTYTYVMPSAKSSVKLKTFASSKKAKTYTYRKVGKKWKLLKRAFTVKLAPGKSKKEQIRVTEKGKKTRTYKLTIKRAKKPAPKPSPPPGPVPPPGPTPDPKPDPKPEPEPKPGDMITDDGSGYLIQPDGSVHLTESNHSTITVPLSVEGRLVTGIELSGSRIVHISAGVLSNLTHLETGSSVTVSVAGVSYKWNLSKSGYAITGVNPGITELTVPRNLVDKPVKHLGLTIGTVNDVMLIDLDNFPGQDLSIGFSWSYDLPSVFYKWMGLRVNGEFMRLEGFYGTITESFPVSFFGRGLDITNEVSIPLIAKHGYAGFMPDGMGKDVAMKLQQIMPLVASSDNAVIVKKAYDWVANNSDHANVYPSSTAMLNRVKYVLVGGQGECVGRAEALRWVLKLFDIDSKVIGNNANSHFWLIIQLDNAWYHADVDVADINSQTNLSYSSFLRSDTVMAGWASYDFDPALLNGITCPNDHPQRQWLIDNY